MAVPLTVADHSDKQREPAHRAIFKQAVALQEQGKLDEAAVIYRKLLLLNPKDAPSWMNYGTLLRAQGHFQAALACTTRSYELNPSNPSVLTNLGNGLLTEDRNDESIAAHEKAVKLSPDNFLIRSNYGISLREAGRSEEAIAQFDIACNMKPEDSQAKWERAITYLDAGDFKRGWEAFEVRWKLGTLKERGYTVPQWTGEDLTGKTIVLHEEQGFGDTMLASRFIPLVKKRGGRVIVQCNKGLHRLFANIEGLDKLLEFGPVGEDYHYHIPMMSLPGLFKTDFTNVPPCAAFTPAPKLPEMAAHMLNLGRDKLRVGIVWSGSVTFARNRKRAVAAERFLPFAAIPGVQLYSLQKGPCEKELAECGGQGLILELGPHLNDFADTAAAVKQLDLVIMTDSSVAHLTGSLGTPIWNLLCYRPYWLYTSKYKEQGRCAWYPSMRYFRQEVAGNWDLVFKNAHDELTKLAAAKMKTQKK